MPKIVLPLLPLLELSSGLRPTDDGLKCSGLIPAIDAAEAKALYDSGASFVQIDCPFRRTRTRICRALVIRGFAEDVKRLRQLLEAGRPVVLYSSYPGTAADVVAAALGGTRGSVLWLADGLEGWIAQGYPIEPSNQ